MKSKSYHHGDLRHVLIETGIKLINQYGEEKLSLRKVAEECGVSNAAPYAHFKSKDEFIGAMQQHVLQLFTATLEATIEKYKNSNSLLAMLGKSYVMFFYQNPLYFDFLFSQKNIKVTLRLDNENKYENPPIEILKDVAIQTFSKVNLPDKVIQNKIIAMWALVHGLSAIITMPNVEYDDNWEVRIEEIISSITIPYSSEQEGEICK